MRVAVLLGGRSAEREVSLNTGRAVAEALRVHGHSVTEVDAAGDLAAELGRERPDAAFVALHGRWGEDGTVQGLLEILQIPYTGSGVLASALAMDKGLSKAVFDAFGVPTPDFRLLSGDEDLPADFTPPFVVKPRAEGSTIGVHVVREPGQVAAALADARRHGPHLLLEAFVEGREVTLGVLEGDPLPLVEIVPESGFYDYEAKYTPGRTRYLCPAPLTSADTEAATVAGTAAYRALGCAGAARVDLILDAEGRPWVLEVNTIPGMTPTSLLPKAASATGMDFETLVARILAGADLKG